MAEQKVCELCGSPVSEYTEIDITYDEYMKPNGQIEMIVYECTDRYDSFEYPSYMADRFCNHQSYTCKIIDEKDTQ